MSLLWAKEKVTFTCGQHRVIPFLHAAFI